MNRKIKILVVTYLPWRDDNNIGNSYSNIFDGTDVDKYEFAHVYVRDGMPQNNLVHEYYHISEKAIFRRLLLKKDKVGRYFHLDNCVDSPKDQFSSLYNKARILRWELFFLIREMACMTDSWKNQDFESFLDYFQPDIVFGTLSANPLISNLMCYVSKSRNIPLITYPWDDHYTINRFSWSPVYWIRKLYGRFYQRKSASQSEFLYVISDMMRQEYENIFKKRCKILFKGHQFSTDSPVIKDVNKPIRLVYMGNIGGGRWKTLKILADTIKLINLKRGKQVMMLNIYSLSPKNNEIVNALNIKEASRLNDPVPNKEVSHVMDSADILVHAEPYAKEDYIFYRSSFSTKLVDYFYHAKAILSLGGMTASTTYLIDNNATLYLTKDKMIEQLVKIADDKSILQSLAIKSWKCGANNHDINKIQQMVYDDFCNCLIYKNIQ